LNCQNCNTDLEESAKFCPQCGQSTTEKLTLGELFRNTVSNYFSIDARLFKSIFPLIFWPGFLPRQFVDGKRMAYLHPAQLYLFVSVIFFFVLSFSTKSQNEKADAVLKNGLENELIVTTQDSTDLTVVDTMILDSIANELMDSDTGSVDATFFLRDFDTEIIDSLEKAGATFDEMLASTGILESDKWFRKYVASQVLKFYLKKGEGFLDIIYGTMSFVLFISIPIFALFLKLLYFKRGSFAHHLVFTFNFFTVLFIGLLLNIVLSYVVDTTDAYMMLVFLLLGIHLYLSLKQFYQQGYLRTGLKTMILLILFSVFLIPFTFILMGLFSFLLY
jgi:hypothetical protein